MELPADGSGILRIKVEEGETVAVGTVIAILEEGEKPSGSSSKEETSSKSTDDKPSPPKPNPENKGNEPRESMIPDVGTQSPSKTVHHASPAANKILSEKGIDASSLKGSGKDGRITKEDALNAKQDCSFQSKSSELLHLQWLQDSREINIEKNVSS